MTAVHPAGVAVGGGQPWPKQYQPRQLLRLRRQQPGDPDRRSAAAGDSVGRGLLAEAVGWIDGSLAVAEQELFPSVDSGFSAMNELLSF